MSYKLITIEEFSHIEANSHESYIILDTEHSENTSYTLSIPRNVTCTVLSEHTTGVHERNWILSEHSTLHFHAIIVGKLNHNCSIITKIEAKSSHSEGNIRMLGIGTKGSTLRLTGNLVIPEGVQNVRGNVIQKNILLGSGAHISGTPVLDIHSNDVQANHSCSIARLSDEQLFYLRSHGIPHDDAEIIMINTEISRLLTTLHDTYPEEHKHLREHICGTLRKSIEASL